jgi:hypothetical protein
MSSNERWPLLADGVVRVEYTGRGWYQVQVGRARGVRAFNLTHAEASQLVEHLAGHGITADPAPRTGKDQVKAR